MWEIHYKLPFEYWNSSLEGPAGTSRANGLLQCIYGTHIPKSDVGNASSDLAKSAHIRATDHTFGSCGLDQSAILRIGPIRKLRIGTQSAILRIQSASCGLDFKVSSAILWIRFHPQYYTGDYNTVVNRLHVTIQLSQLNWFELLQE